MSRAGEVINRLSAAGRRLAVTGQWPLVAAVGLATLAVVEVATGEFVTGLVTAVDLDPVSPFDPPSVGRDQAVPAESGFPGVGPASPAEPRFPGTGPASPASPAEPAVPGLAPAEPAVPGRPALPGRPLPPDDRNLPDLDASGNEPSAVLLTALAGTLPLALARARTGLAGLAITAATLLALTSTIRLTAAGLAAQLAILYLVGLHRSRLVAGLLTAPFPLAALISQGGDASRTRDFLLVLLALATVTAAGAGILQRSRRAAAERDASQQAIEHTLLEHVARGERARIARELHDVVAHHISMIAIQAETARLTTTGLPAEGARRLVAIGDTARAALTEMRRLLGVLRSDAGEVAAARAPQPGLAQLNDLIDEARESSGATTRLILRGRMVPLGRGVELTAYRIVQEALTNARRHAPGAAVDVELSYTGDALHLRVRDNGPGPPAEAPGTGRLGGHGLVGMRERVAMIGGQLRTGPAPAGGFLVEATLPRETTP